MKKVKVIAKAGRFEANTFYLSPVLTISYATNWVENWYNDFAISLFWGRWGAGVRFVNE